jgi:hypothetical protein
MFLSNEIRDHARAVESLRRARASTSRWPDGRRKNLDHGRLASLEGAGTHLLAALTAAQDRVTAIDRLLRQK